MYEMERRKIYSVIGRKKIVCSLTDCQTWTLIENVYITRTLEIYKINVFYFLVQVYNTWVRGSPLE